MKIPEHQLSLSGTLKYGKPVHLDISIRNPFQAEGIWLKGNLHCHPGRHDGSPRAGAEACQWYRRRGFDFLAVRHTPEEMGSEAVGEGFVPVLGDEIHPGHILSIGADLKTLGKASSPDELVQAIHARGGIAVLGHPFWSGWTWEELHALLEAGLDGFEVANGLPRSSAVGRSDQMWIMAINAGFHPAPLGGDDSHDLGEPATGRTWTGVLAEEKSCDAILEAIRAKRTYASEGPVIHEIAIEPTGKLTVRCSPCRACFFLTRGWPAREDVTDNDADPATRFELDFAVSGYRIRDYLVIVLEDAEGNRAWTAPLDVNVTIRE